MQSAECIPTVTGQLINVRQCNTHTPLHAVLLIELASSAVKRFGDETMRLPTTQLSSLGDGEARMRQVEAAREPRCACAKQWGQKRPCPSECNRLLCHVFVGGSATEDLIQSLPGV